MASSLAAKALALMALPGLGPQKRKERLADKGSLQSTFESFLEDPKFSAEALRALLPACEALVARAQDDGLTVLDYDDPRYPQVLRPVGLSPPLVLFVQGAMPSQLSTVEVARAAAVAVVGTRTATQEGLRQAAALGRSLAAAGVVVVSGLALGVDAAAHRGALSAAGPEKMAAPTVAVLGGAHDRLHPRENAGLARKIVSLGGAVISEYPPGVRPNRGSFLARNRIIAGLSRAVVVVEAGERSGALSTAGHASEAGIQVLTVPARPTDRRRAGNLKLLRDGAAPLIDLSDLEAALPGLVTASFTREAQAAATRGPAGTGDAGAASTPRSRVEAFVPSPPPSAVQGALARAVTETLGEVGDVSFDGLLATLARTRRRKPPSSSELAGILVRLEVDGIVVRREDGRFGLAGPLSTHANGKSADQPRRR